jgi:hypothetical protein
MDALKDIICTAADLLQHFIKFEAKALAVKMEEQARSVEQTFKRLLLWLGLIAMGLVILVGGVAMITAGVYALLATATGTGAAAVIVGVILTLLASVFTIIIRNSLR